MMKFIGRAFQKKETRYIQILIIHISETLHFITPNDIYTLFKKGIPKKETLPGRRQEPWFSPFSCECGCVGECVCIFAGRHSNLYKSNPLAPKVYGAANGKRKNPKTKDENRLKKNPSPAVCQRCCAAPISLGFSPREYNL